MGLIGIPRQIQSYLRFPLNPKDLTLFLLKALLTGKAINKTLPEAINATPVAQIVTRKETPGVMAQTNLRDREAERLKLVRSGRCQQS